MSEHTDKYEIAALLDAIAHDNSGHRLGPINGIFLNDDTQRPIFVEVKHGLFDRHSNIVPLRGSRLDGHSLHLGFAKDTIKDAPEIDPNFGLSAAEQHEIFDYYGLADADDADYFHPVVPELADGTEVGLREQPADTAGPGSSFAEKSINTQAPDDIKTRERDAADNAAEAERIRLKRFSGHRPGTV